MPKKGSRDNKLFLPILMTMDLRCVELGAGMSIDLHNRRNSLPVSKSFSFIIGSTTV